MRNSLSLYSASNDVLCHRLRLVLAAKGISYEYIEVDPNHPPDDLIDLNPTVSVPTLVERDLVFAASSVACEYLDERYPHPSLMPVDPLSRARLRLAMLRVEAEWVPSVNDIERGSKGQAETARRRLHERLVAALPLFKVSKFFLNSEISLADCVIAPIIWRLPALDIVLPTDGAQIIEKYGYRIFRSPGFIRSLTESERQMRDQPV